MLTAEEIESRTILRGTVGSVCLGLNLPGHDDRDEMGVCIEPLEYALGFREFEQHISRSQPEGVRSQPGDLDLTIYSLRKYLKLALQGNPSILMLLYVPEMLILTTEGEQLLALRESIVSQRALPRFLGYLTQQKLRLTGEIGQKNVKRPELVEKFGFDTKYAMHAMRLGYQGLELANKGFLNIPLPEGARDYFMSARTGQVPLNEVLGFITGVETLLKRAIDNYAGPLPAQPDYDRVYKWATNLYATP